MEHVRAYFANDHFASENGIELVEVSAGFARARVVIEPRHLNSIGTVQGGALFTLADLAFAGACNSAGLLAVGLNMTISCLKGVSKGTLWAEASELSRTRKISTCTVRIVDDAGDLVALFQGTAYIKGSPFPPT
jgi:acyl-CoA thioesterase